MPSPVGHILAGATVYLAATKREHRSRSLFAATILGSIAPDFDFLPGILIGEPSAFHHGISHSVVFALLYGALVFAVVRGLRSQLAIQAAALGGLGYLSHLVLDFVSVTQAGRGISFLWPALDNRMGINLRLFGHFHHEGLARGIWSVVRWDNVPALLREVAVIGVPLLLLVWKDHKALNRRQHIFE